MMEAINKLSRDIHEGFKKVNDNFKQFVIRLENIEENMKTIKAEDKLLKERVQALEDGKKVMEKNILKKMEDRQNARDKVISGVEEEIKERVDKLEDRQNTRDKFTSSVEEEVKELKNEIRKLKEARNTKNIKTEESAGINRLVPTLYTTNQDNQVLKEIEDRNARRRNVIITGIEEETEEDVMETVLLEKIGSITTSFYTCRIGKANVDKTRPIIVKFENEIDKEHVLCKKWKLKNMTGCEKIFVREDGSVLISHKVKKMA